MKKTAKIQHKGQVTIPTVVREQARLKYGDVVEFSYSAGKIVITPKIVVDRSDFPTADDEYTPAQRRIIDAQLKKSEASYKAKKGYGPFETADEMIKHMRAEVKKLRAAKKIKPR